MAHLWEIEHPYYCTEQDRYLAPAQSHLYLERHESWRDFMDSQWGDCDLDYNLLFRWDWEQADPDDEESDGMDKLSLFFYLQREGQAFTNIVAVTKDDEEHVRAWITKRAEHMRKLWEPML